MGNPSNTANCTLLFIFPIFLNHFLFTALPSKPVPQKSPQSDMKSAAGRCPDVVIVGGGPWWSWRELAAGNQGNKGRTMADNGGAQCGHSWTKGIQPTGPQTGRRDGDVGATGLKGEGFKCGQSKIKATILKATPVW